MQSLFLKFELFLIKFSFHVSGSNSIVFLSTNFRLLFRTFLYNFHSQRVHFAAVQFMSTNYLLTFCNKLVKYEARYLSLLVQMFVPV